MISNILSLLIWIPILSGIILYFYNRNEKILNIYNVLINFFVLALSIFLLINFKQDVEAFQFIEKYNWINTLNIQYFLGVDGISTLLIILNTIIFFIVSIYNLNLKIDKRNQYYASFLIANGLTIGVFSSLDAILFYIFLKLY